MDGKKQWSSQFGFLMAAIGSAVGLGNIWGFPYKMGTNGGFTFLLIYLIFVVFIGFVMMVSELALGRKTGRGTIETYRMLSKKFKWLGWLGVISSFLIMSFYTVLGGYCLKYIFVNVGELFTNERVDATILFDSFLRNPWEGILFATIFLILTMIIVMKGVTNGIEKFSKIAMPVLFLMIIIVIIRSVTLPGGMEGIKFMFYPDFTPLKEDFISVLSTAGGQMFFSLSLGMGCIITYGAYLPKKESISKNAMIIPLADTIVAVLAGLAVMPAAFSLGGTEVAKSGPKLIYITLQAVFNSMGKFGAFFGIAFYILVSLAALTSAISLVQVACAYFTDKAEIKGKTPNLPKITAFICLGIFVLTLLVAYDAMGTNLPMLKNGEWSYLDLFSFISEGLLMPFGALMMALFIGYELKPKKIKEEIELNGEKFKLYKFYSFSVRFLVPVVMLFIIFGQLVSFGIIKI